MHLLVKFGGLLFGPHVLGGRIKSFYLISILKPDVIYVTSLMTMYSILQMVALTYRTCNRPIMMDGCLTNYNINGHFTECVCFVAYHCKRTFVYN